MQNIQILINSFAATPAADCWRNSSSFRTRSITSLLVGSFSEGNFSLWKTCPLCKILVSLIEVLLVIILSKKYLHASCKTKKQSILEEIYHKIFILIRLCSYAIHRWSSRPIVSLNCDKHEIKSSVWCSMGQFKDYRQFITAVTPILWMLTFWWPLSCSCTVVASGNHRNHIKTCFCAVSQDLRPLFFQDFFFGPPYGYLQEWAQLGGGHGGSVSKQGAWVHQNIWWCTITKKIEEHWCRYCLT